LPIKGEKLMFRGFGISGYRSFGPTPQFIAPLEKINIFVGKNNVGKSNVLRALPWLTNIESGRGGNSPLDPIRDFHRGSREASPKWHLPLPLGDAELSDALDDLVGAEDYQTQAIRRAVEEILRGLPTVNGEFAWFTFDPLDSNKLASPSAEQLIASFPVVNGRRAPRHDWSRIWSIATKQTGGALEQHHVPQMLAKFAHMARVKMPLNYLIDAHRQIGNVESKYQGLNGSGLIARLLELQHPEFHKRQEAAQFQRINCFVETVTGSKGARLEVPHSGNELLVHLSDKLLPIASLGTGIQEVVIFAAAATAVENSILLIEEPEIHLHPRLQRSLLAYLKDEPSNQYFITTHSAHLLDAPDTALFHVTLNEHEETEVERLDIPGQRSSVCFDLGYRASDLIQANSIVWVEGPSDRIYVNAWLHHVAPELIEGTHFSVMFYGGRLLSHLSGDDSSVADFISLQRLNRHVAIVLDSDKRTADSLLNATKTRVMDEIEQHGGFAWVSAGREIENYLPNDARRDALASIHPKMAFIEPTGQWDCCYEPSAGEKASVDKIALARRATATVDLTALDLSEQVDRLARFIRAANS
jgi:hypothetical protein